MRAPRLEGKQKVSLKAKLIARIRLSQLFSLPEDEFKKIIQEVENHKLFKELVHKWRIVGYRKFPDTDIRSHALEVIDELTPAQGAVDVEALLAEYPDAIPVIKKVGSIIGVKEFGKFLQDAGMSVPEIIRKCGLSDEEAKVFTQFIDKFEIEKQSMRTPAATPMLKRSYVIAYIERRDNDFFICPASDEDYLAKGRYFINSDRFNRLIEEGQITPKQVREIKKLLRRLELINHRTTTIYQILYHIKNLQRAYLETGIPKHLVPLTQQRIADELGVHPSTICRAIADKSVVTPQGEEKPIKFFFPSLKDSVANLIREIVEEEKDLLQKGLIRRPYSDETIRAKIFHKSNIRVSRRFVTHCREASKIPSSHRRAKIIKGNN